MHFGEVRAASEVAPYNEVLAPVKRAAVVAIFARTRQARHLLLALGARDLLAGLGGPRLPIFVLDAGGGAAPAVFTPAAQAGLLRRVAARPAPDLRVGKTAPRLTTASLRGADGLAVHGYYGLTDEALRDALLDDAAPGKAAARALGAALSSGNAVAAKAVARRVGADLGLLATDAGASVSLPPRPDHLDEECLRAWGAVAALVAVASGALAARCRDVVELLGRRVGNTGAFEMFFARTLRAATRGGGATRAPERTSRRRSGPDFPRRLDAWLVKAEESLAFRLASYRDASTKAVGDAPQFTAFAGGRAISNRRAFRDRLAALGRDAPDAAAAAPERLADLVALVSSFHKPSLRLELLQFALRLDDASLWSVDRLAGALELAEQVAVGVPRVSSFGELPTPAKSRRDTTFEDPGAGEEFGAPLY